MQTLVEAMAEAFVYLDNTYNPKWTTGKGSRNKILEAFSQVDVSVQEYLGYAGADGLRHSMKRAMPSLIKPVGMHWTNWVLQNINKFKCNICVKVYSLEHKVCDRYVCNVCDKQRVSSAKETKQNLVYNILLNSNGCVYCNEKDPIVLEFDHKDPSIKLFNIGESYYKSKTNILEEIAKCDIVCSNCHRRRTAKQYNYFRYKNEVLA